MRLFDEVQAAGYPGGYGRVKRYVRRVRPQEPVEPVRRFETPPGRQAPLAGRVFLPASGVHIGAYPSPAGKGLKNHDGTSIILPGPGRLSPYRNPATEDDPFSRLRTVLTGTEVPNHAIPNNHAIRLIRTRI